MPAPNGAVLWSTRLSRSVKLAPLPTWMPAPAPATEPSLIRTPLTLDVPGATRKTRRADPPEIVVTPAPAPWMLRFPPRPNDDVVATYVPAGTMIVASFDDRMSA